MTAEYISNVSCSFYPLYTLEEKLSHSPLRIKVLLGSIENGWMGALVGWMDESIIVQAEWAFNTSSHFLLFKPNGEQNRVSTGSERKHC